jgi:7,8-dihydroneopterin aldolase/epimerase/oxygenase
MVKEWPLAEALGLDRASEPQGTPTYQVFVRDLVLPCSIGIHGFERRIRQRVRVNVELEVAAPRSFADEKFDEVLNYETIVDGIKAIAAAGHIDLVETFAERVAALSFEDPRVLRVRATVEKLDIYPEAEGVGVSIERRRGSPVVPAR